jgi:hypothetical protein
MAVPTDLRDLPAITVPRLGALLVAIAFLAFVFPIAAVESLHARRLERADRDLERIASAIRSAEWPNGAILTGPGDEPRTPGDRAFGLGALPAARALGRLDPAVEADPWGNAYVAVRPVPSAPGAPIWVLSAGPDGILQTPLDATLLKPLGDDRGVRAR